MAISVKKLVATFRENPDFAAHMQAGLDILDEANAYRKDIRIALETAGYKEGELLITDEQLLVELNDIESLDGHLSNLAEGSKTKTVAQVLAKTDEEILAVKEFGVRRLARLKICIKDHLGIDLNGLGDEQRYRLIERCKKLCEDNQLPL